MTFKTVKVYKRTDPTIPFHIQAVDIITISPEVAQAFFETQTYRNTALVDPYTLVVTINWPSREERDTFFNKPEIIAHFEVIAQYNEANSIMIDSQTEEEI